MMEEILQSNYWDYVLAPVRWVLYLLSLPVRMLSWIILQVRIRRYDPEKVTCPGCGYKGERSSYGRTCTIRHVSVLNGIKAANEHTCFRCSAKFYTSLYVPADKWISPVQADQLEKVKQAAAREIL